MGVTIVNSVLYGTTTDCGVGATANGTVFSLTTSGTETILHSFTNNSTTDGYEPFDGPLLYANGVLYGTTRMGGTQCCGTVFQISLSGTESVVHSFSNTDGEPASGLIDVNGTLYGVTRSGGSSGVGSVYALNTSSGAIQPLYNFTGTGTDGGAPKGNLVQVGNGLYGSTQNGGANNDGVVFAVPLP